jgi:dynein heavy chain
VNSSFPFDNKIFFKGKTVIVNDKLQSLNNELWTVVNVPFNYYTSSEMLQSILEKPLERKAGRNYGPPGSKRLVYFIGKLTYIIKFLFD